MGYGKRSEVRNGVEGVVCSRCKEFKPISEFNLRSPLLRLWQYYCKSCQAAIDKVNNQKQLERRGGRKLVQRIKDSDQSYCSRCKHWKPKNEFNFWSRETGRLQNYCRDCQHEIDREHYLANRERVQERNKAARKQNRERAQEHLHQLFTGAKCEDCGTTDPAVLTFHHVKGNKRDNVSNMVSRGVTLDSIVAEIDKTIVLCWNCHMKREQKKRGSFRSLW